MSFTGSGFQFDYVFDWTILKYQQSQLANPPSRALVNLVFLLLINLPMYLNNNNNNKPNPVGAGCRFT